MKIALLTDGITPYVLGGMQRHSFYLAKYLAQHKVQVDLFHFNQSNFDIEKLEVFSGEEKKYLNSIVIPFPKSIKFPGHYIYQSYKYSQLIFQTIKSHIQQYDFIYAQGFTAWELINQKNKGKINCAPIGVNFHGFEMFQSPPDFKTKLQHIFLLRKPVQSNSQKADLVFSFGGKITSLLIDSVGIPPDKIVEITGGIEKHWLFTKTKALGETVRFIFVGRFERRKGIVELNQALEAIKDIEKLHFTFVGPIPTEMQIQRRNISYVGEIRDTEKLKQIFREHDVLVCPSHSEGMPIVIMEAMANGLTVVATDVGAVNLMVNDSNGWLLSKVDVNLLAETLKYICNMDKQELKNKQNRSIQVVKENFLFEKIIEQLLNKIS